MMNCGEKAFEAVEKLLGDVLSRDLAYVKSAEIQDNGFIDGTIRIGSESEAMISACCNMIKQAMAHSPNTSVWVEDDGYINFKDYCPRGWDYERIQWDLGEERRKKNKENPSRFPLTLTAGDGREFNVEWWSVITNKSGEVSFQALMREA